MVGKDSVDWKDFLGPEDQRVLSEILNMGRRHKGAYVQADDVKIAQLWCAMVEMKKKLDELQKVQVKLEEPFRAIVEIGEKEKRKSIEKIMREIVRPTDESTEEATQELVNSLMKF
jgi:hypothetical protein